MKVKIKDILWDTDGEDAGNLGLPDEVKLELVGDETIDDVADILSDKYGFCIVEYDIASFSTV